MRGARLRRAGDGLFGAGDGAAGEGAADRGAADELDAADGAASEPVDDEGAVGGLEESGWRWLTGRAAGWWFLLAVVVAVLGANAALASWSSHSRPREVGSAAGPELLQARGVAQREFGLLSGGGWGAAWELWSVSARSVLSQAEFVRLNSECRPAVGAPYVIDSAGGDGTTVQVAWHQGAATGSASVVFEGGAWRFVPDAATLADYRLGVDRLVSKRKAAGQCH